MSRPVVDWLLLVVPGVIWGASFLFIAEGLEAVAPNGVTFTRIAIGFLTLSLFPSARKPVARADWAGTASLGVLWLAFPLSMFPFAEQHVSSALTGATRVEQVKENIAAANLTLTPDVLAQIEAIATG